VGDVGVEVKLCMCESVCKLKLSAAVADATFAAVDAAVALATAAVAAAAVAVAAFTAAEPETCCNYSAVRPRSHLFVLNFKDI
jgi:hypothetical protein